MSVEAVESAWLFVTGFGGYQAAKLLAQSLGDLAFIRKENLNSVRLLLARKNRRTSVVRLFTQVGLFALGVPGLWKPPQPVEEPSLAALLFAVAIGLGYTSWQDVRDRKKIARMDYDH